MIKLILFTVIGGLILIWGGILALIQWVHPIEKKHLLGLGGYLSVVAGILIYLVVHTSLTQQDAALKNTQTRLNQELETFRNRLTELTDRLMGQVAEKAELTQSEMEVRGNLQTERAQHARTRDILASVRTDLQKNQQELQRETDAHRAYLDSLNTERALHQSTRDLLRREEQQQQKTEQTLAGTREELSKIRERAAMQTNEIDRLQNALKTSESQLRQALENAQAAQNRLQTKLTSQEEAIETLQAAVDSIYLKTLKRPRVGGIPE